MTRRAAAAMATFANTAMLPLLGEMPAKGRGRNSMMFLSACVVTTCLRAWAQQPACVVGGTVTDSSSKQPVVRARVIAEVTGAYSLVQLTDRQGNFCFPHLSPATYHVLVQKAGYMEAQ